MKIRNILVLILVFVTFSVCSYASDFLIVGHMGAPNEKAENTLSSMQKAVELGANALEMDLSLTKDGYVIIWHDWEIGSMISHIRQIGKEGLKYRPWVPNLFSKYRKDTTKLTLKEIRENFGYTESSNSFVFSCKRANFEIPTFLDLAEWLRYYPSVKKVFLDIKVPEDKPNWTKPLRGN